ncbi:hypothetical protein J2W42_005358 [Rhizobium tibeticum]|nr:hypothetical protein [Rhizobium tibeticum]
MALRPDRIGAQRRRVRRKLDDVVAISRIQCAANAIDGKGVVAVRSDERDARVRRSVCGEQVVAVASPGSVESQRVAPDAAIHCRLGIILCGTGQGIMMAANKVKGIRCGVRVDTFSARMIRQHNDANMLSIGARGGR